MATDAATVAAQGADHTDEDELDTDGHQGAEGQGGEDEGGDADEPEAVQSLAQQMGWVPKDKYTGPADAWKPASQFILDGREIQRTQASEIKGMRQTLDTVARTSGQLVEDRVRERVAGLQSRFEKAVEDGDTTEAFKISREIGTVTAQLPDPNRPAAPSPVAQEWVQRHSSWFQKDPLATARAMEIANNLALAGFTDPAAQLDAVEKQMKKERPELFGLNGQAPKPPAGVHTPGQRGSGGRQTQETFAAMPKAAQDIATDLANRGLIPSKDEYVKNYFANMKAKG